MVAEHAELWLRLALRGPFCLVRKHTVVHQTTRGSLMERGIREHQYIRSFEVMGETVIEPLAQSENGIGAAARGSGRRLSASLSTSTTGRRRVSCSPVGR
jgi:hypothetical protein